MLKDFSQRAQVHRILPSSLLMFSYFILIHIVLYRSRATHFYPTFDSTSTTLVLVLLIHDKNSMNTMYNVKKSLNLYSKCRLNLFVCRNSSFNFTQIQIILKKKIMNVFMRQHTPEIVVQRSSLSETHTHTQSYQIHPKSV